MNQKYIARCADMQLDMDDMRRDLAAERTRSAELSVKARDYAHTIDELSQELHECQRERDALKARLAEARWLLEHVWNPSDRDADYLRRYDAWLKGSTI